MVGVQGVGDHRDELRERGVVSRRVPLPDMRLCMRLLKGLGLRVEGLRVLVRLRADVRLGMHLRGGLGLRFQELGFRV
jgi:hypothetical protein